jgi:phage protein D
MQRASDIQFLRSLARRNGKLCRVACTDTPGQRTGYFSKPDLSGDPVVTLELSDPNAWTVDALDLEWDVTRPTEVLARQALFDDSDQDGAGVDQTDSGLDLLEARSLSAFAGKTMSVMLTTPVDDAQELTLRAESVLREAGWFVRCEGESDVSRLGAVLRVGTIVQINSAGALHSGKYFVWSVRHTIDKDSHRMKFVLVRNAVGAAPSGSGGLLGALL